MTAPRRGDDRSGPGTGPGTEARQRCQTRGHDRGGRKSGSECREGKGSATCLVRTDTDDGLGAGTAACQAHCSALSRMDPAGTAGTPGLLLHQAPRHGPGE